MSFCFRCCRWHPRRIGHSGAALRARAFRPNPNCPCNGTPRRISHGKFPLQARGHRRRSSWADWRSSHRKPEATRGFEKAIHGWRGTTVRYPRERMRYGAQPAPMANYIWLWRRFASRMASGFGSIEWRPRETVRRFTKNIISQRRRRFRMGSASMRGSEMDKLSRSTWKAARSGSVIWAWNMARS